jgi:hypothetical protein
MTEYYFFKIVFTKWQKLAQNQITHSACFFIIRGFVNNLSPQIFSGVGSPYVSLCSSPHKHHLPESPLLWVHFNGGIQSPVPIQLQGHVV